MKRLLIWLVTLAGCGVLRVPAAISVGPGGTGLWTFDTAPAVTEWATMSVPGSSTDITSDVQLDAAVQSLSAAVFTNALPLTATFPPSVNALARYNTSGRYLQTLAGGGTAATVFMVTLQNDTGRDESMLTVSYDFRLASLPSVTIHEDVPG
jgi:hypothetical protein